jgi:hypothetical protein
MKKNIFNSLVYGNTAVAICINFTVATIVDLLLCVLLGITDISYLHLWDRFILCTMISFSFNVFKLFENLSIFIMLIIHFFLSILIMISSVWFASFFIELHPDAYPDAIRTILIIYPIMIIIYIIFESFNTLKANKILKKHLNNE